MDDTLAFPSSPLFCKAEGTKLESTYYQILEQIFPCCCNYVPRAIPT